MKDTRKSAQSTTAIDKKFEGFADKERAAMKERAQGRQDPDHRLACHGAATPAAEEGKCASW